MDQNWLFDGFIETSTLQNQEKRTTYAGFEEKVDVKQSSEQSRISNHIQSTITQWWSMFNIQYRICETRRLLSSSK